MFISHRALSRNLTSGETAFYKIVEPGDTILFLDTFYPAGYLVSNKDGYLLSTFQRLKTKKLRSHSMAPAELL